MSVMRVLAVVVCVCVTLTSDARAQEPAGRLAGVVVDPVGAPVSAVPVVVRDGTGREHRVVTNAEGRFAANAVAAGAARITVSLAGWQPFEQTVMAGADRSDLRLVLQPAGVQESVVVIGSVERAQSPHPASASLPTSVDIMGGDQIARENVDLSYELLKKVPGVYVNDYNQGVVAGGVAIRGFNTEGDIMHVKLLIDGIPANANSGAADLNAVFPLNIDRMELVKGTNDPRYGLFNIAGNVQIFTSQPGRYTKVKLMGGAYDTADVQATTAFQTGRLSHVYTGGYRSSAGYRQNADLDRSAFSGKWVYTPADERWSIGVVARTHDFDTQAPGYLTPAELAVDPRQSPAFSATDGGKQQTRHVSLHLDRAFGATLALSAKVYGQTFWTQRWVRFTAAGLQQERLEDERQSGLIGTLTWRPAAWAAAETTLSAGVDVQSQDNVNQRFRTVDRVRGVTLRDHVFDFTNGGAYLMVDTRASRRVRLTGGLRADRVGGTFRDTLASRDLPIIDYGTIWQPKIGATVQVHDRAAVYGNYGRSFQVGVGSAAYGQTVGYSKNDGWEVGVRGEPTRAMSVRVGIWGQEASDELRLKFDDSGDSENVGRTRRRGWNVELTARPHSALFLWGTYTRQRATLVEPGATQPELRGKELNHVPTFTAKVGADVTPTDRLTFSLWTEMQGDYYLTTANTLDRFGDRSLTNVDVNWRVRSGFGLGVHLRNAFDGYHEYVWFDGATTLHSPGEGRALSVTTTWGF